MQIKCENKNNKATKRINAKKNNFIFNKFLHLD